MNLSFAFFFNYLAGAITKGNSLLILFGFISRIALRFTVQHDRRDASANGCRYAAKYKPQ